MPPTPQNPTDPNPTKEQTQLQSQAQTAPTSMQEQTLPPEIRQISEGEYQLLQRMADDLGFLAFHTQRIVLRFVEAIPPSLLESKRMPNPLQMAQLAPKILGQLSDLQEGLAQDFPRLKVICEQYAQLEVLKRSSPPAHESDQHHPPA